MGETWNFKGFSPNHLSHPIAASVFYSFGSARYCALRSLHKPYIKIGGRNVLPPTLATAPLAAALFAVLTTAIAPFHSGQIKYTSGDGQH